MTGPLSVNQNAFLISSSSRQPPLIEPARWPLRVSSIRAPGTRYEEPRVLTTVASTADSPDASAFFQSRKISSTSFMTQKLLFQGKPRPSWGFNLIPARDLIAMPSQHPKRSSYADARAKPKPEPWVTSGLPNTL